MQSILASSLLLIYIDFIFFQNKIILKFLKFNLLISLFVYKNKTKNE